MGIIDSAMKKATRDIGSIIHDQCLSSDHKERLEAIKQLQTFFLSIRDKQRAWNDLLILKNDEICDIRASAKNCLGKVSVFNASQASDEENYKKEFDNVITFFEEAFNESSSKCPNLSQFCLPFFRSFYSIIFKKQEAKEELDRDLAEAKSAIKESQKKKLLYEAVENLKEALREVQNLENQDFESKKSEMNSYRKYYDNTIELLEDTNIKSLNVTEVLRKGLPILDRNIKEYLEEIQKNAKNHVRNPQYPPKKMIPKIDLKVSDFKDPLKRLNGQRQLNLPRLKFLKYAMTAGMPIFGINGVKSSHALILAFYKAIGVTCALDFDGPKVKRSQSLPNLDPTEQANLSTWVGMGGAALVADEILGVSQLLHADALRKSGKLEVNNPNSRRLADLVGQDIKKKWHVIEAKARQKKPSKNERKDWKDQADTVGMIDKQKPATKSYCYIRISNPCEIEISDPDSGNGKTDFELTDGESGLLEAYYHVTMDVLSDTSTMKT